MMSGNDKRSPSVTEVAAGLYHVIGPRTNWCLVREGQAITLVDAAWPRDFGLVAASIDQVGARIADVEAVVLTHAHPDHVGVAERLRSEHAIGVYTHHAEAGHATGEYEQHARRRDLLFRAWRPSALFWLLESVRHGAASPTPVKTVSAFGDTPLDVPGRLVPVPTPGHTSGHCAFHLPDKGALITGDALVSSNILTNRGGPRLMPRIYSHDWEQAAASLDRLTPLEADLLLPGHGEVLHMTPAEAVQAAKERLAQAGWWDR